MEHTPEVPRGNIVQSCDLCRIKKRRCDLKEGVKRCSSCTKSKTVCQITHVTKPRERKKKKQIESLDDRLKSLEELIRTSLVAPQAPTKRTEEVIARTPTSLASSTASVEEFSFPINSLQDDSRAQTLPSAVAARPQPAFDSSVSSSTALPTSEGVGYWSAATPIDLQPKTKFRGDKKCSLPPAEGGFFLLQEYLMDFNAAVPLFDRVTISTCFEDCYSGRSMNSTISWVTLKLVLAIAHRLRAMSPLGVRQDTENAEIYLEECLSDLNQLVMEPPSLLLCQCYIAFAVVISSSSNPQPAAMFVSMALRVTQDLRINDSSPNTNISPRERLQRQRVFWIAFVMDADWGLKAGRSPSLSPKLITIELPAKEDPDAAGEICAVGGEFQMNIFRLRAELALIQAELMEQLQTPDASKNPGFNHDIWWQNLALRLDSWRKQWPGKLTVEQLQKLLHRSDLVHVIAVEAAIFSTLYLLLAQLPPETDARTRPFSAEGLMEQLTKPQAQHAYNDAKRLASLLSSVPGEDVAINWLTLKAIAAALAVLLSYIINNPEEEIARSDITLCQPILHTLNQLCNVSKDDDLSRLQNVCVDLYLRAERALQ